jgi:hypothetical protein
MSVFITGDTHGVLHRLSNKNWKLAKDLTENDFVIIAGDFGLIYHPEQSKEEIWWINWLNDRPFTTLFVDGNHENHDKLKELPTEIKFGGAVGKVSDKLFHLRRGEIYTICDKKILTFGGAESIDKVYRIEGISWWKDEIPNYYEMDICLANLELHSYEVDYIIAHTCPLTLSKMLASKLNLTLRDTDPTTKMLEHIVSITKFSDFYCGHWHIDEDYGKYHFLYTKIHQLI